MGYERHPKADTPGDDETLWRYIDFVKFVDLLDRQALWLTRTDQLEDPLEARLPAAFRGQLRDTLGSDSPRLESFLESGREVCYVNCWHANSHESMAMWELYSQRSCAIAICSSVGRMKQAFAGIKERVVIGRVTYLDSKSDRGDTSANILAPCFQKDHSYAHENEVRVLIRKSPWEFSFRPFIDMPEERDEAVDRIVACLHDAAPCWGQRLEDLPGIVRREVESASERSVRRQAPLGIPASVDLGALMGDIVVGPHVSAWVEGLLRAVAQRYGVKQIVRKSTSR